MSEPMISSPRGELAPETPGDRYPLPVPRCCERHPDWPTLAQHLSEEFPEVPLGHLVRELREAKGAVERSEMGPDEALATAELITRYQLMRIAGRLEDHARLDPERHERSGRGQVADQR